MRRVLWLQTKEVGAPVVTEEKRFAEEKTKGAVVRID